MKKGKETSFIQIFASQKERKNILSFDCLLLFPPQNK